MSLDELVDAFSYVLMGGAVIAVFLYGLAGFLA